MTQPRPHFERHPCKRIIRRQMNRSGNILLSGLEPLEDSAFFAQGLHGASPAWTVGHLACVTDLFDSWIRGQMPALSTCFHAVFNSLDLSKKEKSKAETVSELSYTKQEIIMAYRQAQVRALETLDAFDVSRWDERTPHYVPDSLTTYGEVWEALGVHTYWHLGELCGAIEQFHGTYTLNSILHYFYVPPQVQNTDQELPAASPVQPIAVNRQEISS